jgi:hypothetical protein
MQAPGEKGEDPSGNSDLEGWTVHYFDDGVGNIKECQAWKVIRPPGNPGRDGGFVT